MTRPVHHTRRARALVVDDEALAVRRLVRLLDATERVNLVRTFTDAEEAAAFLSAETVDLLFLDIEMPGMNGFDLLARLADPPVVIFTTAFDHYALRAFEVSSIDYLLKPIEAQQLDRALDKYDRLRGVRGEQPDWRALAEQLASNVAAYPQRISSRIGDRTQFLDLARITHFISEQKLTYAVGAARRHIVDHSLAELEQQLDPKRFLRIHRSILLNVEFLDELQQSFAKGARVRLRDERHTELPVARDRLRALKEHLGF